MERFLCFGFTLGINDVKAYKTGRAIIANVMEEISIANPCNISWDVITILTEEYISVWTRYTIKYIKNPHKANEEKAVRAAEANRHIALLTPQKTALTNELNAVNKRLKEIESILTKDREA